MTNGVLGGPPPGFPPKETLPTFPRASLGNLNPSHHSGSIETTSRSYKLGCPRLDETDFRGWWAKLEQYFEAEGVTANARVGTVILHLEGKALDWHHFYTQR